MITEGIFCHLILLYYRFFLLSFVLLSQIRNIPDENKTSFWRRPFFGLHPDMSDSYFDRCRIPIASGLGFENVPPCNILV